MQRTDQTMRFEVQPDGWVKGAVLCPSTHCDERPEGSEIELLVVHNISLPPGKFGTGCVQRFFTDRLDFSEDPSFDSLVNLRVASHFLIERTGKVTQFLSCLSRGWHAGVSAFEGRSRCNDFSIGIELEGTDFTAFEDAQYESLHALTLGLLRAYPIRAAAGHSDIAPGRKTDPGPFFDWSKLASSEMMASGLAFPFLRTALKD